MANLSKAQIEDFFDSPVWKEINTKIDAEVSRTQTEIENPDPFLHGKSVGERKAYNSFLGFKEILLTEASGKSPYANKS